MSKHVDKARSLRVALVQERNQPSTEENLALIERHVASAAARGAQLVLLQELHNGAYFCQHQDVREFEAAEAIPGPSTERIGALAKQHGVVIVSSLFERRAAGLYHNTAVVLEKDGSIAGKYRKMHIPDDPGFNEKFYFTPGDMGFTPIDTSVGRLGVLVCWDQWYPEAARLTALAGADVLLYPTAIGWHPEEQEALGARQHAAWETIQRSHAIANGVYVASPNRVGHEDELGTRGIEFFGHSFIADPFGRVLAEAGTEQAVLVAQCDPKVIEETRRNWPFLRDRRIDAYGPILSRYLDG
jgi:N-carbamoylputrescine amidase